MNNYKTSVFIIAEAGVNHNGDINIALKLIDEAVSAGANAVKFQTFRSDKIASSSAEQANYQIKNMGEKSSQQKMLKKLELSEDDHNMLLAYCKERNIEFLSTAFDEESIDLLDKLKLNKWKIPSGEITNLPYLRKIAAVALSKEVILSTGMSFLGEVESAINILTSGGISKDKITLLHCTTEYPAPIHDANLKAMVNMGIVFGMRYGYSDHTCGIEIPIAACALGAKIIEKHFTLDKTMPGPDHAASLEPKELKEMVRCIRNVEMSLGDGIKRVTSSESKNRNVARKSIHLSRNMYVGEIVSISDLVMKRPGNGISPMEIEKVIGKKINKKLPEDTLLTFSDIS